MTVFCIKFNNEGKSPLFLQHLIDSFGMIHAVPKKIFLNNSFYVVNLHYSKHFLVTEKVAVMLKKLSYLLNSPGDPAYFKPFLMTEKVTFMLKKRS
jgi:hypothetical protein